MSIRVIPLMLKMAPKNPNMASLWSLSALGHLGITNRGFDFFFSFFLSSMPTLYHTYVQEAIGYPIAKQEDFIVVFFAERIVMVMINCHYKRCRLRIPLHKTVKEGSRYFCCSDCARQHREEKQLSLEQPARAFTDVQRAFKLLARWHDA